MARPEIDFLVDYTDAALLDELRRIAQITASGTVTTRDLKRIGRASPSTIIRRFGSLRRALQLAGLSSGRFMKATDEELIAIIIDLWLKVLDKEGRSPQQDDLKKYGFPLSYDTINRRFGSWRKALVKAHSSVTEESVGEQQEAVTPEKLEPRKREALSIRKRFFVLKRDHFKCVRCGARPPDTTLEVHHRFPFAKGGGDSLTNLETLCYECNRGQSDTVV